MSAGTLLGVLWMGDAPVIGPVPTGLPALQFELPSAGFLVRALEPAIILALLGSVDSLLTSLVADSLIGTRHNPDRELVGQGVGNMVAGLFGALPGAGATMGTVVNIRAGGTTPLSGALRAPLLLALVLGLGRYVEPIPLAALAGVLMKVGWDIIDWRLLASVHRIRREHLFVMLMTLGLTVFVDLVTAVAIGLIAAGMVHARQLERLELDSVVSVPLLDRTFLPEGENAGDVDPHAARVGLVALRGTFTVASSHKLVEVIGADIKDHEVVIFDFSGTTYVDDSAAMVIEQLMEVAEKGRTGGHRDGSVRLGGEDPSGTRHNAACAGGSCRRHSGRRAAGCQCVPAARSAVHVIHERKEPIIRRNPEGGSSSAISEPPWPPTTRQSTARSWASRARRWRRCLELRPMDRAVRPH